MLLEDITAVEEVYNANVMPKSPNELRVDSMSPIENKPKKIMEEEMNIL